MTAIPDVEVELCILRYDGMDEDGDHWLEEVAVRAGEEVYLERYLNIGKEWKNDWPCTP